MFESPGCVDADLRKYRCDFRRLVAGVAARDGRRDHAAHADNLNSASTSMPTSGSADVVSDSSSQAVLPVSVDEAMQRMQGMFRNVGLNLSKVVDGPQQVPEGSASQGRCLEGFL